MSRRQRRRTPKKIRRKTKKKLDRRVPQIYVGRVQKNQRGFAFLIVADKTVEDVYLAPVAARDLFSGDEVRFKIIKRGPQRYGKVLNVVHRVRTRLTGIIRTKHRKYFLETPEMNLPLQIPKGFKAIVGNWAMAKIERYPSGANPGSVRLETVYGEHLEPSHDIEFALAKYDIADRFPSEAVAEASRVYERFVRDRQKVYRSRRDLRSLAFVTIDGEDAKDFDDAVLVRKERDRFILSVAIADVAYFVNKDSHLDRAARDRATSVYFPGRCVPMLPERLSNDLCSLRPKEDKLALVAELTYSADGRHERSRFYEAVIKTKRRLTYTQVQKAYQEKDYSQIADVESELKCQFELFSLLKREREKRGALDFELPETEMDVDESGFPVQIRPRERWEAHALIEEFMIAANRAVARLLKEKGQPALYRVHEAPQEEGLDDINTFLKAIGIHLRIEKITPKNFANVLKKMKDRPGARSFHQVTLRQQKQACYHPEPKGHFGLALRDYTHFTSPIRRYPDLVVHRALKAWLRKKKSNQAELAEVAKHTSDRERNAMEAERFVIKKKQCWFLTERVGDRFRAEIASITPTGVFAEIEEFGIQGFLPPDHLIGFYEFDSRRLCLRKRPGNQIRSVGDPILIEVEEVEPEENWILFREVKSDNDE